MRPLPLLSLLLSALMIALAPAMAVKALPLTPAAATDAHCSDMGTEESKSSHDEQRQACLAYCLTVQAGVLPQLLLPPRDDSAPADHDGFPATPALHAHVAGIDPPPPRPF